MNTSIFIMGLAVGTTLLVIGSLLGYWFGRRSMRVDGVNRKELLKLLREFSQWTNEYSGDVSLVQSRLNSITEQMERSGTAPTEEILGLLSRITDANKQLQERLDFSEQKLETQTDELSSFQNEARTDALTGLWNRRAFDQTQDELFDQWNSSDRAFALALIDIDHFKKTNDTYGHPAGDEVLREVARVLQSQLGAKVVCVARYGGEEFAVLAQLALADLASEVELTRQVVEDFTVTHEDRVIQVSISAGIAVIAGDDKIGNLVRRADEALYAAKLGGRNRVYVHDGTICRLITDVSKANAAQANSENRATDNEHKTRVQQRLDKIVEEESRRVMER